MAARARASASGAASVAAIISQSRERADLLLLSLLPSALCKRAAIAGGSPAAAVAAELLEERCAIGVPTKAAWAASGSSSSDSAHVDTLILMSIGNDAANQDTGVRSREQISHRALIERLRGRRNA